MEPFGTGWKVSDPLKKHSCWSASIVTTQVYRKQILNKRVKPLAFKSQTLVVPIQHLAKNMAMKRCNLAFLRTFITFALGPNMAMASFVFDQRKNSSAHAGRAKKVAASQYPKLTIEPLLNGLVSNFSSHGSDVRER